MLDNQSAKGTVFISLPPAYWERNASDMEIGEHTAALKAGEVSLLGAVMTGAAVMAPTASILFGVALVAGVAGSAVPLIFLIAAVGVLATGNTLARFARIWPSAGSFVTFITRVFGSTVGLAVGVAVLLGWLVAYAAVYVFIGDFLAHDFFGGSRGELTTSLLIIGFVALVLIPVVRGVQLSVRVSLIALLVEVALIVVLGFSVLVHGGAHGISLSAFALPDGGLKPIALGFAITVFLFGGFEQPVPMAEETRNPRRNVPLAVILCIVGIGALYVFASWFLVLAFGDGAALAQQADPIHAAAARYAPWLAPLVKWILLSSFIGFGVAANTAVSRIVFNTAREGLLPKQLGALHRRHRTPAVAAFAFGGAGMAIGLGSKLVADSTAAVTLLSTVGSLLIISMYVLVNAALVVWWWRERRASREHGVVAHVVVPVAGIAVLASPYYYNLKPGQPSPLDLVPWGLALLAAVAAGFTALVRRRSPDLLATAGRVIAGEADASTVPEVGVASTVGS
jgi:amino acid transporter